MLSLMGACTSAGQLDKSSAKSATGRYGSDSFTLVATSPANLGLTFKSQCSAKAGQHCESHVENPGDKIKKQHQKTDKIDEKTTEQTAKFNIPLTYYIAGCTMELARIDISIDGRYGVSSLDIGGDIGGISVTADSPTGEVTASSTDDPEFRGLCKWMFQLSSARIEKDGISKILSCSAANKNWNVPSGYLDRDKPGGTIQRSNLENKNVKLTFRLSKDEEPSMDNRWIKTTKGWKPCQGTATSNRCQTPPIFKKFKMNDRECIVYPNCIEMGAIND